MTGKIEHFQNADGGWPYGASGPSWTEPTTLALLAQIAQGHDRSKSVERGVRWLETMQSKDGGWPPQASVPQSTWVSALVALLPEDTIPPQRRQANIKWLLDQTGQETTPLYRVRQWLIGNVEASKGTGVGWPWFPGASAWVTPTAFTILALQRHRAQRPDTPAMNASLNERIADGQRFLIAHACVSGGWNHGGAHALGFQANGYPETTGIALLALRDTASPVKNDGLNAAERFLADCRSAEGVAWLTLGLQANGRTSGLIALRKVQARTVCDLALLALADRAQAGTEVFGVVT
jgi:hypothetical protein